MAASRDMVNGLLTAVRNAGLHAAQVDLTSFAVLRSVGRVDHLGTTDHVEALIDIGASVTNIVVHANGAPRFVRLLLKGGADITEALARPSRCAPSTRPKRSSSGTARATM